jgi:hypothetical protein
MDSNSRDRGDNNYRCATQTRVCNNSDRPNRCGPSSLAEYNRTCQSKCRLIITSFLNRFNLITGHDFVVLLFWMYYVDQPEILL